jgi:hypothetical protein
LSCSQKNWVCAVCVVSLVITLRRVLLHWAIRTGNHESHGSHEKPGIKDLDKWSHDV